MRSKIFVLMLLLLPLVLTAQKTPRKVLHGRIIDDALPVRDVSVMNVTSNIGAVTDQDGFFSLFAKPADTLLLSGAAFRPTRLILKKEDFLGEQLEITLDINVTVLDEVVIRSKTLTGKLDKDSKDSNTRQLGSAFGGGAPPLKFPKEKAPQNTAMPVTESSLQGVDFKEIYKMIFKKKKKKDKGEIYNSAPSKSFSETVRTRFTHYFFTQTLKIPHEEIGLFLNFCDEDTNNSYLLDPKNEFELTDYLVNKSAEYLKKEK